MIDKTKKVRGFILVDPIHNTQDYIVKSNIDLFNKAKEAGCIFVVEYMDGTRDLISPEEIDLSLTQHVTTVNLVQQEVFVPMMNALAELLFRYQASAVKSASVSTLSREPNESEDFFSLVEQMNERYGPNLETR